MSHYDNCREEIERSEKERIYAASQTSERPFSRHDARMAAATTLVGDSKVRHRAPLEDVSDRVQRLNTVALRINENLAEIGHKLRHHADLVSGEQPETAPGANSGRQAILDPAPPFGGALGEVHNSLHVLEDALHRLDECLSYCAYQAGRNTTLA